MRWILLCVLLSSCYSGVDASKDINRAWQGRQIGELHAQWGKPADTKVSAEGSVQVWAITNHHFSLPELGGSLDVGPNGIDLYAKAQPGESWQTTTKMLVAADTQGVIRAMHGPSIRWGRPRGANLRSGLVMGLRAGMSRLDDTETALPGTGVYIGGMLGPRLALVGNYSLASGKDENGGAMAMAWSLAPKYWLSSRVSVRGGPAIILAYDPGFEDLGAEGGFDGTLSYALVRLDSFVLDLRVDLSAGPNTQFASVGIGVNVN